MIFPARLKEVRIIGARQEKERIISELHDAGVLHITESTHIHERLRKDASLPVVEEVSEALVQLNYIAEQTGTPKSEGVAALPSRDKTLSDAKHFLAKYLDGVRRLAEERDAARKELERLRAREDVLSQLPPITARRSRTITTELYRADKQVTVRAKKAKVEHLEHHKAHYYVFTLPNERLEELEQALQGTVLKRVDIAFLDGASDAYIEQLRTRIADETDKLARAEESLKTALADRASTIQHLIASLEEHYAECTLPNRFQESEELFTLRGYCTEKDLRLLKRRLRGTTILAQDAGADAPTKLENGRVSRHFQVLTELFSMPRNGAVDPSRIMTFFYPFFFGIMLSDIGYGLMLAALAITLRLTKKESMRTPAIILGISAASTIAFGLVLGSFFGGLIPVTPLWGDSFSKAMPILIASLIIGLVHINLGVLLRIIQGVRMRAPAADILKEAAPILLLQAAAALFFVQQAIAGGFALISAAAILVWRGGPLGILDMSGYVGTWFSYARLLALSLATAGVALAVNTMAGQVHALGWLGVIAATVILVFGHLFNFVVNLIGSAINAARLNYVEFFGLFFEGGGQKFSPFQINKRR